MTSGKSGSFGAMQKVEWALILLATILMAGLAPRLPRAINLGQLLTLAAIALLLQGFFRDLWILRQNRLNPNPHVEYASCMCVESTLGLTGVFVGLVLTACGARLTVVLGQWTWPVLALAVWAAGYAMRNFVLQWRPWAIRRVANHGSLIVRWR